MFSQRFQLPIVVTAHARERMVIRRIDEPLLLDIIDSGVDKSAGGRHHWVYKRVPDRDDNLLCVAALIDTAFVVKTIMHHWELAP